VSLLKRRRTTMRRTQADPLSCPRCLPARSAKPETAKSSRAASANLASSLLCRSARGGSGGSRQWTISLGTEDRASAWSAEIWSLLAAVAPLAALFVRWSRPVAQPLEAHAVHPASAPVHRNAHACLLQHARELRRGELAALVEVEDLRMAEPRQGFLQRLDAERHVHGVRHPPGRHLPARPVHHRDQIKKATPHRTSALPNLVGALRE